MAQLTFEDIKRLTIIALVSDDALMERLVLKGGNAIRLAHAHPVRQSLDLDFSLEGDFAEPLEAVRDKMERLLTETFQSEGYNAIDVRLTKAPPRVKVDVLGEFWGGYELQFKIIQQDKFDRLSARPERRPVQAEVVGPRDQRIFRVDISKFEYCAGKEPRDLDGFTVYVYSSLMIVCEKIRAICQQMAEYRAIVFSSSASPRARDFFDIHHLVTVDRLDLTSAESWNTLRCMFEAKRVPMRLLGKISTEREFHRENFEAVRATVDASYRLRDFDFYVDFLVAALKPLQPRWEVQPPVG